MVSNVSTKAFNTGIPGSQNFLSAVIPVLNLSKYLYYGAGFFFEITIIIIIFMPNNLSNSDFAFQLKVSLACRMNVGLVYHHCHSFLHKSIQDYAELNLDPLLNFERSGNTKIIFMVANMSKYV